MIASIITSLFSIGPLLFGLIIMAPFIAALMGLAGISAPFGLTPLQTGLIIGFVWGSIATKRGSWI
jgi:hypothetical protein